jgi:hypothetical protein
MAAWIFSNQFPCFGPNGRTINLGKVCNRLHFGKDCVSAQLARRILDGFVRDNSSWAFRFANVTNSGFGLHSASVILWQQDVQ